MERFKAFAVDCIRDNSLETGYHQKCDELLRKLANSDVILKPCVGSKNLLVSLAAGCVFIGPEELKELDFIIDANRQDSNYRIKLIKQEGRIDETYVRLFGVIDWGYCLNRRFESFDSHGFKPVIEFPWERYEQF